MKASASEVLYQDKVSPLREFSTRIQQPLPKAELDHRADLHSLILLPDPA